MFISANLSCTKAPPKIYFPLMMQGNAKYFSEFENPSYNAASAVENSLVIKDGVVYALFDPLTNGAFHLASLGDDGKLFAEVKRIGTDMRFSYTMKYAESYYTFAKVYEDIFLWSSNDLEKWQLLNSGKPVLSAQRNSIYQTIWNVGVAVDDSGEWHMLIEASPASTDPSKVGLGYSHARWSKGEINFNTNASPTHVIPRAGNPWLGFLPGLGLLAVYGVTSTPIGLYGDEWYIGASKLNPGSSKWIAIQDFRMGRPGIHVCDPHLVELPNGGTMLTASYDQDSIYKMFSEKSLKQIFFESKNSGFPPYTHPASSGCQSDSSGARHNLNGRPRIECVDLHTSATGLHDNLE